MGIFDNIGKKIEARESGIKISDLLDLPRSMRTLMNRAIRDKELSVETGVELLGESPDAVREMLDTLTEKGYLQCEPRAEGTVYRVRYGRTNPKDVPGSLWASLETKIRE